MQEKYKSALGQTNLGQTSNDQTFNRRNGDTKMSKQNVRIGLLSLLVLILAACSQDVVMPTEIPFISEADGVVGTEDRHVSEDAIIAELTSESGSTFRFIDESLSVEGGGVGVLELTVARQETVLPALEKAFEPTALEVYLALAPENAAVPARLREAHAATAEVRKDIPVKPRQLNLATSQRSNLVGPLGLSWCRNSATFQNNFHNWFFLGGGYAQEGYGLDIIWNNTGTTGVASRRVLAACNNPLHTPFADSTPVKVRVEAQFGANLWFLIGGTNQTLDNEEGMYYLSDGFQAQRYRIVANAHPWAIYSLAGAWGKK